ncbi:MAG: hypothetical protein LH702_21635, partial [Phormidesmis sp. CAN_BIN44]|nr:hypothetical protein [Phormidesmis sp. CAN_BIN44]
GKNYTLSPIRWDALSSFPLTAFPKDAGDQTVPIDGADSCTKNTMKHGLDKAFGSTVARRCRLLADANSWFSFAALRLRHQLVTDRAYIPRHKAQGFYAR